jgi:23S rRNA (adenine2030-N6)-methyltransferase
MNYQHIYHAGNFADIAKHVALIYCLKAMKRKEQAFFVLDTHAGRGFYDLQAAEAVKSQEAERGIQKLIVQALGEESLHDYFAALKARRGKRLARYPGSPALIAAALRSQDRAVLTELIAAEARSLERELDSAGRLLPQVGDGYQMLKAQLPPPERRGLVLIDPPYESIEEFKHLLQAFAEAYRRWPTGTFLVWYPIRSAPQRSRVHERFVALKVPKMLAAEIALFNDDAAIGMAGSGLIIVNPPFGIDAHLTAAYRAIHKALATEGGGYAEVTRLTAERVAQ